MNERHPLRRKFDQIVESVRRQSAFSRRKPRFPGELHRISRFQSNFLETPRDVIVYLPPGYQDDVSRRFPVVYMQDGQNLFEPGTAFIRGQHWRVGETIGGLIQAGEIAPMIAVGIYNTGEKRIDEYTPIHDPRRRRGGGADRYGRMILDELKPRIDRDYRTLPDQPNTALAGSSLGGLLSLHLGLQHPDHFGKLAILSPSVWWADKAILHSVKNFSAETRPRIWLDVGTAEGVEAVTNARMLAQALVKKGWKLDQELKYVEEPGAGHSESAWAARFSEVVRFLFGSGAISQK